MDKIKYIFEKISYCEMCGSETSTHFILGQRLNSSQGKRPKKKTGITVTVSKCSNCGLIYSNPQPIPENIQDHYGIPPENYWRPEYFNWTPSYFSQEIKTAKDKLNFKQGMSALDVGAGIGKCMISLEKAGFSTYGFEPSKPFYEKAISTMKIKPEHLRLGMIEEVEYEPNSFDFITFGAVFEHLYHPAKSLEKALNWLKPGGVIHIEVPSSKHFISRCINAYYKLIGTNYVTNISPMHEPFHLYEFDLKSFQALEKKLGFTLESFEYYVCEILFFPKFFHGFLNWYMKKTNKGMQLTVWIRKNI